MSTAGLAGRRPHDEEFFIKKRDKLEIGFGNGKRDERKIEAAVEQTGKPFLQ